MLYAGSLAKVAQQALVYEVLTYPKPGLVDPLSAGAHADMDTNTFIVSAMALQPYFVLAETLGATWTGNLPALFATLRLAGVEAEAAMFDATNGVNTHKGAIFSLGILVAATAYTRAQRPTASLTDVINTVKTMLAGLQRQDFSQLQQKDAATLTAGERQYLKYGITGIRGEAEAGFPSVLEYGLPYFLATKGALNQRLTNTVMYLSQQVVDSNLIKRGGGPQVLTWWRPKVTHFFALGGSRTPQGQAYLTALDRACIQRNLSFGGSADLLILTIFLAASSNQLRL